MESKEQRDEAEGDILDLLRRNDTQNFRLMVTCVGGHWCVEVIDLDVKQTTPRSDLSVGIGRTFTEAWTYQTPSWAMKS